jgi:TonB family protein
MAWAAVLLMHGAAVTGLASAYRPPLKVPERAPVEVFMLRADSAVAEQHPLPMMPLSLESPSQVMLPIPSLPASAVEAETPSVFVGQRLTESVPPPELTNDSLPALGPEALAAAAFSLQLPDDRLNFLQRPPLDVPLRAGQARLALRFHADGSLRRVDLLRSSGRDDWDAQALAAWRLARIAPPQRDGRTILVYTEVEQALPLP